MPTLVDYKGLMVLDSASGLGGEAINDDLKLLADRATDAGTFRARLTLESGVPVPTSDQNNKTTLYLTPDQGEQITLFDGTNWNAFDLTEISISNAGLSVDTNYDVFVHDSGGPTLELVAWTNNTTRATALAQQDGVYVKSGATTRRYVGTVRTVSDGGTAKFADTTATRLVWNEYHRRTRHLIAQPTDTSHTYTTNAYREWNNGSTLGQTRVAMLLGRSEDLVLARARAYRWNSPQIATTTGIGIDSTTSSSAVVHGTWVNGAGGQGTSEYVGFIADGYHTLHFLERSAAQNTTGWAGNNATWNIRAGLVAEILA